MKLGKPLENWKEEWRGPSPLDFVLEGNGEPCGVLEQQRDTRKAGAQEGESDSSTVLDQIGIRRDVEGRRPTTRPAKRPSGRVCMWTHVQSVCKQKSPMTGQPSVVRVLIGLGS